MRYGALWPTPFQKSAEGLFNMGIILGKSIAWCDALALFNKVNLYISMFLAQSTVWDV